MHIKQLLLIVASLHLSRTAIKRSRDALLQVNTHLEANAPDIVELRVAVRKYLLHPLTLLILAFPMFLRNIGVDVPEFPAFGLMIDNVVYIARWSIYLALGIWLQPYFLRWLLIRNISFMISSFAFFAIALAINFLIMHSIFLPDQAQYGGIRWFRLLRQLGVSSFLHAIVCVGIESSVRHHLGHDKRLVPYFWSVSKSILQKPAAVLLASRLQGDVAALNSKNQYVAVHGFTTDVPDLVRMTFVQAMAQMPLNSGLRLHRSWWVSRTALDNSIFDVRKMQLEISLPLENKILKVPVSKSYLIPLQIYVEEKVANKDN